MLERIYFIFGLSFYKLKTILTVWNEFQGSIDMNT